MTLLVSVRISGSTWPAGSLCTRTLCTARLTPGLTPHIKRRCVLGDGRLIVQPERQYGRGEPPAVALGARGHRYCHHGYNGGSARADLHLSNSARACLRQTPASAKSPGLSHYGH